MNALTGRKPSPVQALQTQLHPAWFQGRGKRPPYFEGWYFKLVNAAEDRRYAIIPGISLNEGNGGPHAFVQVLEGSTGRTAYHRYPLDDFWAARDAFDVRIGPNRFTADFIELAIAGGPLATTGKIHFTGQRAWPVTLTAPGIMGWYAWIPFMECYHGVLSLDHRLDGALTFEGEAVDFSGGRGYIEKDWGQAFPAGWIWLQTNHFAEPRTSLTASIALIPWLGRTFRGFIVGLWHKGILYRFATYTGARTTHLAIDAHTVHWHITDALYRLEIVARRSQQLGALRGPTTVDMGVRVLETLDATVAVRLYTRRPHRLLFAGEGRNAGLEIGGDLERLLAS